MEQWKDQGIVVNVRPHGESGAIVSLMTQEHGCCAGYVRGAHSSKMRGTLELGSLVDAAWQSRVSDGLGTFSLELSKSYTAGVMQDAFKLSALQSVCALCHRALPEGEAHVGLFEGMIAFLDVLQDDMSEKGIIGGIWGPAYVMWEIAFLKELGFALDLTQCAGGGDPKALAYVSPKTGRAVSYEAGLPYHGKLLELPNFLKLNNPLRNDKGGDGEDVLKGLFMTGYFMEHWVFNHHTHGVPDARLLLAQRLKQAVNARQADNEALKEVL